MQDYYDDDDFLTDEEKQTKAKKEYTSRYEKKYLNLSDLLDEDEFNEVTNEFFKNHNIARSNNPELDCEFNFAKAIKAISERDRLDAPSESFLNYISKKSGKSKKDLKKWAKNALKGEAPISLYR